MQLVGLLILLININLCLSIRYRRQLNQSEITFNIDSSLLGRGEDGKIYTYSELVRKNINPYLWHNPSGTTFTLVRDLTSYEIDNIVRLFDLIKDDVKACLYSTLTHYQFTILRSHISQYHPSFKSGFIVICTNTEENDYEAALYIEGKLLVISMDVLIDLFSILGNSNDNNIPVSIRFSQIILHELLHYLQYEDRNSNSLLNNEMIYHHANIMELINRVINSDNTELLLNIYHMLINQNSNFIYDFDISLMIDVQSINPNKQSIESYVKTLRQEYIYGKISNTRKIYFLKKIFKSMYSIYSNYLTTKGSMPLEEIIPTFLDMFSSALGIDFPIEALLTYLEINFGNNSCMMPQYNTFETIIEEDKLLSETNINSDDDIDNVPINTGFLSSYLQTLEDVPCSSNQVDNRNIFISSAKKLVDLANVHLIKLISRHQHLLKNVILASIDLFINSAQFKNELDLFSNTKEFLLEMAKTVIQFPITVISSNTNEIYFRYSENDIIITEGLYNLLIGILNKINAHRPRRDLEVSILSNTEISAFNIFVNVIIERFRFSEFKQSKPNILKQEIDHKTFHNELFSHISLDNFNISIHEQYSNLYPLIIRTLINKFRDKTISFEDISMILKNMAINYTKLEFFHSNYSYNYTKAKDYIVPQLIRMYRKAKSYSQINFVHLDYELNNIINILFDKYYQLVVDDETKFKQRLESQININKIRLGEIINIFCSNVYTNNEKEYILLSMVEDNDIANSIFDIFESFIDYSTVPPFTPGFIDITKIIKMSFKKGKGFFNKLQNTVLTSGIRGLRSIIRSELKEFNFTDIDVNDFILHINNMYNTIYHSFPAIYPKYYRQSLIDRLEFDELINIFKKINYVMIARHQLIIMPNITNKSNYLNRNNYEKNITNIPIKYSYEYLSLKEKIALLNISSNNKDSLLTMILIMPKDLKFALHIFFSINHYKNSSYNDIFKIVNNTEVYKINGMQPIKELYYNETDNVITFSIEFFKSNISKLNQQLNQIAFENAIKNMRSLFIERLYSTKLYDRIWSYPGSINALNRYKDILNNLLMKEDIIREFDYLYKDFTYLNYTDYQAFYNFIDAELIRINEIIYLNRPGYFNGLGINKNLLVAIENKLDKGFVSFLRINDSSIIINYLEKQNNYFKREFANNDKWEERYFILNTISKTLYRKEEIINALNKLDSGKLNKLFQILIEKGDEEFNYNIIKNSHMQDEL